MSPRHRPRTALRLQPLEGRLAPANLTVTFSPTTHVLTVVGDNGANDLTIQGDPADPTHFTLSSADTINGAPGPFATPSGVWGMNIRLLAGNDRVTFGNAAPVRLRGALAINGGDGANAVGATGLSVGKGLTITNGVGADYTGLLDLSVGGPLTIRNGDGGSQVIVQRSGPGVSAVGGSVLVANGAGEDFTTLTDLNVGGGVAVRNGRAAVDAGGNPAAAGTVGIYNLANRAFRSQIRGGLSVSYLDGRTSGNDAYLDLEVGGDVTLAYGSGAFDARIDGYITALPVAVRGNLTVTGTGPVTLNAGASFARTGVVVGQGLRVTTGAGADAVVLHKAEVGGATTLKLGDGANTVTIDDSLFAGAFALTTGAGADRIDLDTQAGSTAATTFKKAVVISEGAGVDSLTLAGGSDANQALVFLSTVLVRHGVEADTLSRFPGHEYYLFGTTLQYVV